MQILGAEINGKESVYHIVQHLRDIRISDPAGSSSTTSPLSHERRSTSSSPQHDEFLGVYPGHIFETASQCHRLGRGEDEAVFHSLWHQVLAYWFPHSEGYNVVEKWHPHAYLEPTQQALISVAVFYQGQPIVLLLLQRDTDMHGELALRVNGDKTFDTFAVWSGLPAMCVIVAAGARWSAFVRPTDMTTQMVNELVGYDWYGNFEEDVWSEPSYQALRQYFKVLKDSNLPESSVFSRSNTGTSPWWWD